VDLDRGEVVIRSGRVALGGGRRTVTEEPKSSASRRTVEVEQVQPGTVALLRALKARQAADRLALGAGYPESGLVVVDGWGCPCRRRGIQIGSRSCAGLPVSGGFTCMRSGTPWR